MDQRIAAERNNCINGILNLLAESMWVIDTF